MPKFTPTEQKLLKRLSDGNRHLRDDLKLLLPDHMLNQRTALPYHMSKLRKKLNPIGEEIVCEFRFGKIYYRHVRLIGWG